MILKIVNVAALILVLVVNYLANALPLNGKSTGEISAEYSNLFTPAGLTFSIWGVIYLLLIIFCVIQFTGNNNEAVKAVGWLFAVSSVLNALWLFAWHYEYLAASVLVMLLFLISLILINNQLLDVSNRFVKITFGIYLGWIMIATIANITVWLVSVNWNGFGTAPEWWAGIMIVIGLIISVLAVYKFENPFIALSVIWAFAGIAIRQNNQVQGIFLTAALSGIALLIFAAFIFYRQLQLR
jgi:hypothetical protein